MGNVLFCADPHLDHKRIPEFREGIDSVEQNSEIFFEDYGKRVSRRDIVYFLGDVSFSRDALHAIGELAGKKILIRGNHDLFRTEEYLEVFDQVYGIFRYKDFWLTHAPVHPRELRGKLNIHGHVHDETLADPRYMNVSVDNNWKQATGNSLIALHEIRDIFQQRRELMPWHDESH